MLAVVRRVINVGCLRAPGRGGKVDANKIINLSKLIFYGINRGREREEAIFLVRQTEANLHFDIPKTEIIASPTGDTETVRRPKENNLFVWEIL